MKSQAKIKERNATRVRIRRMQDERKKLLAQLLKMSELTHHGQKQPDAEVLERFCELVVDYIAAGHFGLYQRIVEGTERRNRVTVKAQNFYPEIEKTTQIALDFSEKYKIDGKHDRPDKLQRDLSGLGEALTMRIELEDQLIAAMLDVNHDAYTH